MRTDPETPAGRRRALAGPDAAYRRVVVWLATLRRLGESTDRFATLRSLRELHLGPVPRREPRIEAERHAAFETLDAVESGVQLTSSHDWLDRVVADAASIAGARIPLHCPRCVTPLRVRGRAGVVRVRCPHWRCRFRREYAAAATP